MADTLPTATAIVVSAPAPSSEIVVDRSGAAGDKELVELWLATKASAHTRRAYAADAETYLEHLHGRGRTLRTATVADALEYVASLDGAESSRARRVSSIKSMHSFATKTGFAPFNVAAVVSAPKVPNKLAERILDEHEVHKLLEASTGRLHALLRLLYAAGARVAEACALRWEHVHVSPDGTAVLTIHGKGGKTRFVRISAATVEALRAECGEAGPAEYVFSTRSGAALNPVNASKEIRALSMRVLGKPASAHFLRHAHASHAIDRGSPMPLVRDTLGHTSLATTSKYAHAKPGESSGRYLDV